MKAIKCLIIICLFTSSSILAQVFYGSVVDGTTKEPLIGVNIIMDGKGIASTDVNGYFELSTSVGVHNFTFSYIGIIINPSIYLY